MGLVNFTMDKEWAYINDKKVCVCSSPESSEKIELKINKEWAYVNGRKIQVCSTPNSSEKVEFKINDKWAYVNGQKIKVCPCNPYPVFCGITSTDNIVYNVGDCVQIFEAKTLQPREQAFSIALIFNVEEGTDVYILNNCDATDITNQRVPALRGFYVISAPDCNVDWSVSYSGGPTWWNPIYQTAVGHPFEEINRIMIVMNGYNGRSVPTYYPDIYIKVA
jgi:hypothetical protein